MKTLTPAKINLMLEIVGRRADGFHDLTTWMLPIALYDSVEIEAAKQDSVSANVSELRNDQSNLVVRARDLFAEVTGIRAAYRITLEKNIPMGAGLGGGSSDAAATLRLLNQIHRGPLDIPRQRELAARLGSDVAFFLEARSAWCTGRGEVMGQKEFDRGLWICLFKPAFGVSTAFAYQAYAQLPDNQKKGESVETKWGTLRNDLEQSVFRKYLLLPVIKDWLREQPETIVSLMSGSGSTMFAVVKDQAGGRALVERFRAKFGDKIWNWVGRLNPAENFESRS
jgi:4-diphosphocytidyl-2-C-methyl-D-erythritol kinase